jgi:hypothetical protein
MAHILTECSVPGQKEVWKLASALWGKKHKVWPKIQNIGSITGCGLANFQDEEGRCRDGANRLY